MNKTARNLAVSVLRDPYAWPGGYERMIVTADGALLCSQCVKERAREIIGACRDNDRRPGWFPDGVCYEAVSPDCTPEDCKSYCGHCGKEVGECA